MADDAPTPTLEVISEHEIAKLRLVCFQSVVGMREAEVPLAVALAAAERLYNWCMEFEDKESDPATITGEDQCERKH
jgi:hypothetical protein